jgi:hypothetical protein
MNNMDKIKPKHIAWFLPAAYLLHLLDEYFIGAGFAGWFSMLFKASLSESNFIVINAAGLTIVLLIAILYTLGKANNIVLATVGSLFFINGIIHPLVSFLTATFSPGTITGVIIYLPFGLIVFIKIFPLLQEQQRMFSVVLAIALQILVSVVALNI